VDELERAGRGYVKALVLDPFEVRQLHTQKLTTLVTVSLRHT
jgi:hypothetical protein